MNKKRTVFLALAMTATMMQAQTILSVEDAMKISQPKSYKELGIHDPSIVFNPDDQTYYIMGSHIGFGKSTDLTNLSGLSSNIYKTGSYATEFKSCPEHYVSVKHGEEITTETLHSYDAGAFCATYAGIKVGTREPVSEAQWISGDQWAPDLIYNPYLKKWCMYISLNGDYWASVIVMLTADKPTGPFSYEAPIVFGGFNGQTYSGKSVSYKDTDLELVLGEQSTLPSRYKTNAWGNLWPNCIDPCVFFDGEGELWMAYGSWSGGIFMLKLDKETGLRDYTVEYESKPYSGKAPNGTSYTGYLSDPYFGKLIAGGAYVSGEGPYIQKIGDYYYLFVTYGGLAPDGGYEMRIFRSSTPDGNYLDALGNNARYTQYYLNFGPKATTNKGMKIIGSMNDWGTMTVGECAEGHNSAIVDKDGDAFIVYHTKFNNGTQGFQVRIRQLFTNESGWLVASPFRFTGKHTRQMDIDSKQLFSPSEIEGTYSLLIHPYRLNHNSMAEAKPIKVTLSADGKISGDRTGTWEYSQENKSYVNLIIGGVTYNGVALRQNVDGYQEMPAICFSAVSKAGVPAWLFKLEPKSAVADAYRKIMSYLGSESSKISTDSPVIDNVEIVYDVHNALSGNPEPDTFSQTGEFTPTEDGHAITLSATISSGDYRMEIGPITRSTRAIDEIDITPDYYPVSQLKNVSAGWWQNFSTESYNLQKEGSIKFHFYNYSDEAENWHSWVLYGASATHGASGYNEYFGVRNDNWDNTSVSNDGCTSDFNWDTFKQDMNGSLVNMTVNYSSAGVFKMTAKILTKEGKEYNYSFSKAINSKPENLVLFFVSEKSYIDGEKAASGIRDIWNVSPANLDTPVYNLNGQRVDSTYKGIVIKNGKKYVQK